MLPLKYHNQTEIYFCNNGTAAEAQNRSGAMDQLGCSDSNSGMIKYLPYAYQECMASLFLLFGTIVWMVTTQKIYQQLI